MNKHTATMPDGTVSTRNSKTRLYTHAVAILSVSHGHTEASWGALSWHGSEALAHKAAKGATWAGIEAVRVVPAEVNAGRKLAAVEPVVEVKSGPSHDPSRCAVRGCALVLA